MDPKDLRAELDQVQLVDVLDELNADQPVVAVGRSGGRRGTMAEFLADHGYRAARLEGDMQAWVEAGLPVQTPDDQQPGKVA